MMTFVCDILNAVGKGAGEGRKRVVMAGPWVRSRIASSRLTEDPDPVCFVKKYEKKTHISGTAKFDQDNSFVALSSPVCNATTMFRLSRIETLFRYRKQSYPAGTEKGRWCLLIRPHIQLENTHFECFCRRAPAETFAAHVAVRYLDFPFARSLSVSLCHTHSLTHTHTHKFVDWLTHSRTQQNVCAINGHLFVKTAFLAHCQCVKMYLENKSATQGFYHEPLECHHCLLTILQFCLDHCHHDHAHQWRPLSLNPEPAPQDQGICCWFCQDQFHPLSSKSSCWRESCSVQIRLGFRWAVSCWVCARDLLTVPLSPVLAPVWNFFQRNQSHLPKYRGLKNTVLY